MKAEAVREMVGRRPFGPFEVIMSGGEAEVVKHPIEDCIANERYAATGAANSAWFG